MNKIASAVAAGVILLSGCTTDKSQNAEQNNSTGNHKVLLTEDKAQKIAVYGVSKPESGYSPLTVQLDNESRDYEWSNTSNPSFYPKVILSDLNGVEGDEIAVVLTTATGTGVRESEVHVLTADFTEIPVSDPKDSVRNEISSVLQKGNGEREYTISVSGKDYPFKFNESDAGIWFDQPVVGNIVRYFIQDHVLTAELSIQISPGMFIGNVLMRYAYVNGTLEPDDIGYQKESL
ncbi:hypothetical protein NST99_18550 [Paenibacillus sp. FSL L8-0470]|uniref:hypothetical protein n=1 Tax=unclassified Paenibacillus TaxID=185978 RepID=UPI0030F582C7